MTHTLRTLLFALAAVGLFGLATQSPAGDDKEFKDLFNGKNLDGWKTIIAGNKEDDGKVFSVKEGVVVVAGKPNGYFYTDKSYKNYVLRYDWKFIKDGNSGLLVHITGKHSIWPKCVEVQGQQSDHGNIFAIGGAKGKFKKDADAQKKAIKKGEWNTTEVTVKNGDMTSKINGMVVCTGTAEGVTEGPFGFQSEGTELHFKNIKIKVLD